MGLGSDSDFMPDDDGSEFKPGCILEAIGVISLAAIIAFIFVYGLFSIILLLIERF